MKTLMFAVLAVFAVQMTAFSQQYDHQAYQLLITDPEGFRTFLLNNGNAVVNLRRAPLNNVDLSRMQLDYVDFSYAQLEGANFKESNLNHALFIGAIIKNANFNRTSLEYTDFSKANATDATFTDAHFKFTELTYLLCQVDFTLFPAVINDQGFVSPASK